jgi:RNA polymerase sigma-70 factor, ECF subfamily
MDLAFAMRPAGVVAQDRAAHGEADLVARARRGDQRAFEALVGRYSRSVLNVAYRIVSDRDAAQDVAQEALVGAFRRLDRFRGDASFGTWLYRITVNQARMHVRSESRRRTHVERLGQVETTHTTLGDPPDEGGPLTELMRELPEKQRVALALFYLDELSLQEIAQAAGAPVGTVKAWLSRGRDNLRRLADERGLL